MKEVKIESTLRRVNDKLVQSMDSSEKQEVIDQFKALYSRQMKSLSLKISKGQKVTQNIKLKQMQEDRLKKEIKESLEARMEVHFKKREDYQENKLNNFKRMELKWKDKLRAIGEQMKQKQKQSIILSNRLSKQVLMFWQSKDEKAKNSPSQTRKASQRYKLNESPNNWDHNAATHFLTEANLSPKDQQQQRFNFPSIKEHSRMKTQGYMSLAVDRIKSESIKQHLVRSNDFWKAKEDSNFQKAMQKMEKIEVTRSKVKQKLFQAVKVVKQSRLDRDDYHRQNRSRVDDNKQSTIRSVKLEKDERQTKLSNRREYNSSKVQKRRMQLHERQFESRGKHFEMVLVKDRKRGYRKMVRQGVNLLKLQALKRK